MLTERLRSLSGGAAVRGDVIAQIALPQLRESAAALLSSPSRSLRLAAARSPVLRADPRSAPVQEEGALSGEAAPFALLLVRNPGAPPGLVALALRTHRAIPTDGVWWRGRAWLASLAALAHLKLPAAAVVLEQAVAAVEAAQLPRSTLGPALLALSAMGPALEGAPRLVARLRALRGCPRAAFPLAAMGDEQALHRLVASPHTAALVLAFGPHRAQAVLSEGLALSEAGLAAFVLLRDRGWAGPARRALAERAAAALVRGQRGLLAAQVLLADAAAPQIGARWLAPLLTAPLPPDIRRVVLAVLTRRGIPGAESALLADAMDVATAALLPLPGTAAVEAAACQFARAVRPDSPASARALRVRLLLALRRPPLELVAEQLRCGRTAAITAALRLPAEQGAAVLAAALSRPRLWCSSSAIYRFRSVFAGAESARGRAALSILCDAADLRVSMLAIEALERLPIPAPVDPARPGSPAWIADYAAWAPLICAGAAHANDAGRILTAGSPVGSSARRRR